MPTYSLVFDQRRPLYLSLLGEGWGRGWTGRLHPSLFCWESWGSKPKSWVFLTNVQDQSVWKNQRGPRNRWHGYGPRLRLQDQILVLSNFPVHTKSVLVALRAFPVLKILTWLIVVPNRKLKKHGLGQIITRRINKQGFESKQRNWEKHSEFESEGSCLQGAENQRQAEVADRTSFRQDQRSRDTRISTKHRTQAQQLTEKHGQTLVRKVQILPTGNMLFKTPRQMSLCSPKTHKALSAHRVILCKYRDWLPSHDLKVCNVRCVYAQSFHGF